MLKTALRIVLAVCFIVAGTMHFLQPAVYLPMMPPILPQPLLLIYLSGLLEIVSGIGLLIPRMRRRAGQGMCLLLVAVFPANVHMLSAQPAVFGMQLPEWILWLRLPFQGVLIAWAYWVAKP